MFERDTDPSLSITVQPTIPPVDDDCAFHYDLLSLHRCYHDEPEPDCRCYLQYRV